MNHPLDNFSNSNIKNNLIDDSIDNIVEEAKKNSQKIKESKNKSYNSSEMNEILILTNKNFDNDMILFSKDCLIKAFNTFDEYQPMAQYISTEMEKKYSGKWNTNVYSKGGFYCYSFKMICLKFKNVVCLTYQIQSNN
jgi:hypothetical protein